MIGAILAGGRSQRMGTNKALVPLTPQPRADPMAGVVAGVLTRAGLEPVILVGGDPEVGTQLGLEVVPDRWPGEGPLGGLASAVAWGASSAGVEIVVVAACDQPAVTPATIKGLVAALRATAAHEAALGAAVVSEGGEVNPFPSAWLSSAGPALVALVDSGRRRAFDALTLKTIAVERPGAELTDLDTPEDLERYRDS